MSYAIKTTITHISCQFPYLPCAIAVFTQLPIYRVFVIIMFTASRLSIFYTAHMLS